MQLHVNAIEGKVLVTLPEPMTWLYLTPEQAGAFADLLKNQATMAIEQRGEPKC